MTFLYLILKEIKHQYKSVIFYTFAFVVFMFYVSQYNNEANRLKPPNPNSVYKKVQITSIDGRLVLGYKELYGILKGGYIEKYVPTAKKIKLDDDQMNELQKFIDNMAPNADVLNIEPKDIKIDYESMIDFMNKFDYEFGGNTVLGPKYRQFMRAMTYEEALKDYENQKNNPNTIEIYARNLADYLGVSAGLFVVFLSAFTLLKDKFSGTQDLIYSSNVKAITYIGARFLGLFICVMSVFISIALIEAIITLFQAIMYGVSINLFSYLKYIIIWVAPTVMFCVILPMLLSIISENSIIPIAAQLALVMFLLFNTGLSGDYDFMHFIIRFNGFDSNSAVYYQKFASDIKYNRIFYVGISFLFFLITTFTWSLKRNKAIGGISRGNQNKPS